MCWDLLWRKHNNLQAHIECLTIRFIMSTKILYAATQHVYVRRFCVRLGDFRFFAFSRSSPFLIPSLPSCSYINLLIHFLRLVSPRAFNFDFWNKYTSSSWMMQPFWDCFVSLNSIFSVPHFHTNFLFARLCRLNSFFSYISIPLSFCLNNIFSLFTYVNVKRCGTGGERGRRKARKQRKETFLSLSLANENK